MGKVVDKHVAAQMAERARREGKRVVFTNGCFDLLHDGHIHSLRFAKKQGHLLIVGLNSDSSVRSLKGTGRPVLPETARAAVVEALEMVDLVVIFDGKDACPLVEAIRPDVYVKGEDWRGRVVPEAAAVEKYGGRLFFAPLVAGISTTERIKRIRDANGEAGVSDGAR